MDIQLILEMSAIAMVISAIISYITFRKSSSLTYVTQERKEWREAIRKIAENLETCTFAQRKQVLVQLKTHINAYGLNSESVLEDAHIWKHIQKIEACEEDGYEDLKNQLILYLSLLLKYDWERSKREVIGEPMKAVEHLFIVVALMFLEVGLYQVSNDVMPGLFVAVSLLGIGFIFSKTKNETTNRVSLKDAFYPVLVMGCLPAVILIHRFTSIKILNQPYISLAVIAGYFAASILLMIDLTEIFNNGMYECCINKISGQAQDQRWLKWKERWKQKMFIIKRWLNAWKSFAILALLIVPQIVLALVAKYGISENIGSVDKLSLHIATSALSVTIIIALLVYWLQKSDEDKEQVHRQQAACTSMRYAIENGICWLIGREGDTMLGAAATIKETANQYRQELLDVLTEQQYNEMILVVEGINDAIRASRDEDVDACVTEDNRARMFLPWINTIRWSRYHSYLSMAEDFRDLLSEMMVNLLNALGGTYTYEHKVHIQDKNHKPLIEWNEKTIKIHQGEEVVLDGSFAVDESAGSAQFVDGWAKNDEYIGFYAEGMRNGKGCSYGCHGEKLKEGIWEKGELKNGIEYACLIHVEQGSLIFNPEENDYDASDYFEYSVYEQYGMNIIPFMNSATYIEHYNLTEFYVADLKIEDDMEQLVNIQSLEEYLKKKNPEKLQELQEKLGCF